MLFSFWDIKKQRRLALNLLKSQHYAPGQAISAEWTQKIILQEYFLHPVDLDRCVHWLFAICCGIEEIHIQHIGKRVMQQASTLHLF